MTWMEMVTPAQRAERAARRPTVTVTVTRSIAAPTATFEPS
jgi:hypothetical protein